MSMNIQEYRASLQPLKKIDVNVYVLDYNFNVVDEISGVTVSGDISIDADADVRRTVNISIALSGYNVKQSSSTQSFNYLKEYYIGDIVQYDGITYQCVAATEDGYITNVLPTDKYYWKVYAFSQNSLTQKYWSAGNPYWFDKYIKIEVGTQQSFSNEIVWTNLGIYLINTPTITYNATTNTLSFQGVDLMSKLTGLRNGYLEGITYQIVAGTTITSAMRDILIEQGFPNMILETPPTITTPTDINIDVGETAYDLLTQLRDINPNWEMFFDVNGTFRFQEIPSGDEVGMFGNEVWDKVGTSYEVSTSFEDVKNYIEIVGKQIEPNETAEATYSPQSVTVTLARPFSSYYSSADDVNVTWYIGFTIGSLDDSPIEFTTPISNIVIKDSVGAQQSFTIPSSQEAKVYYSNEAYFVRLVFSSSAYKMGEFGGYLQPRAIAFESNSESPFYVGDSTNHTSTYNNVAVNFVGSNYQDYIDTISAEVEGDTMTLNLISYISANDFNNADNGKQWAFKTRVGLQDKPIKTVVIQYGGSVSQQFVTSEDESLLVRTSADSTSTPRNFIVQQSQTSTTTSAIYVDNDSTWSSLRTITLDYSNDYLIILQKVGSTLKVIASYYPLPSNLWNSPTTKVHSIPRFSKMVRGVYSGDEYDNIYSNDLASQRAKYELYLHCRLHDSINITSAPLYWLDVNKVVRFGLDSDDTNILWIVKTISMSLAIDGTQTITATRYYPLYQTV